jgi:hypothetical protein
VLIEDAVKLTRVLIGEGTEDHGVDQAEHGGIGANAEPEREHDRRRESGRPGQPARAVADVAAQPAQPGPPPLVARPVLRGLHAAEAQQRLAPRLGGRNALADEALDLLVDVEADLFVEPVGGIVGAARHVGSFR